MAKGLSRRRPARPKAASDRATAPSHEDPFLRALTAHLVPRFERLADATVVVHAPTEGLDAADDPELIPVNSGQHVRAVCRIVHATPPPIRTSNAPARSSSC